MHSLAHALDRIFRMENALPWHGLKLVEVMTEGKRMANSFVEYPETSGKTVEQLRYYSDPTSGNEVHIRFTDGTSLSLKLTNDIKVEAEMYRVSDGDVEVLRHYPAA